MKQYTGTKTINAKPMNRLDYNIFRGWDLPTDENGEDEGYLVEYIDGGKANTTEYSGYVSWSPADVFDKAYSISDTFMDRLIIEHNELMTKLHKLHTYLETLTDEVPTGHEMLVKQQIIMKQYLKVLADRLALYTVISND